MIDPVALAFAGRRDAGLYVALALAGAGSSFGPCLAPRAIAVATFASGRRVRWPVFAAFALGTLGGYLALGLGVQTLVALVAGSAATYLLLAAGFAVAGLVTLAAPAGGCHVHERRASLAGVAGLGAAGALVVSPCCTPIVVALGAAARTGDAVSAGGTLLAFTAGHLAPVIACAALGERTAHALRGAAANGAAATVSGAVMLALGAYYAVLA